MEALGAEVIELPAIEITPVDFTVPELAGYAWIVFTSANGVRAFFERGLDPVGRDARALAGVRVAAIGPGTTRALAARGIRADLVPERFVAESLLAAFPSPETAEDRVLFARAEQARDVLPEGLGERGYTVDVLAVYRTKPATPDPAAIARCWPARSTRSTFTSSSTVDNFCAASAAPPTRNPSSCRSDRSRRRRPSATASASTPKRPSTPSTASSPRSSDSAPSPFEAAHQI